MSRQLITAAGLLAVLAGAAHAQPASAPAPAVDPAPLPAPSAADPAAAPAPTGYAPRPHIPALAAAPAEPLESDVGDQAISAQLGLATGARATPGGLRIAGHYLYQLAERDWFDGIANFTFGGSRAACFRDRADKVVCNHGLADGAGVEVVGGVRRMFAPQGAFRPYARLGVGLGLARFADDDVSGFTIEAHAGGGVRVKVAPSIAIVGEADLALGFGSFNRALGTEPQVSLAVTAGVEFRLR
ncbi:MAG: hypothetical protein ABIY55_32505 [Kofleriaceae bacterium]